MKQVVAVALSIGISAGILTGCSGTQPNQGKGDPSAPGYNLLRTKDAIFIAHHYPEDVCYSLEDYDSRLTVYYSSTKEYHCEDYGRVDDGINCGEEDYRNADGGTSYLSDCITGGNGMQAGKKTGEVNNTFSIKKIFSDFL